MRYHSIDTKRAFRKAYFFGMFLKLKRLTDAKNIILVDMG